ncbi:MAG: hypothetical protein ACOC35_15955, partial [Promethearchaeia archaeon]
LFDEKSFVQDVYDDRMYDTFEIDEIVKEFKERTEELGAFEKYLPLWGALWIIFGIVLSQLIPEIRINENS